MSAPAPLPNPAILTPITDPTVHVQVDRLAQRYLDAGGIGMDVLNALGGGAQGLLDRLPEFIRRRLDDVVMNALERAYHAAERSRAMVRDRGDWFNRLATTVSGAAGGVAGLPGAMLELPVTVTMLFRSILEIAAEHGFDPADEETRLEALRIFASAGPMAEDDGADLGLLAARMSITGQTVQSVIARVAPRLSLVLGEKLAAQAMPVFGAMAGATINYTFVRYYQEIARVNFGALRLARESELTRETILDVLRLRIGQLQQARAARRA